METLFPSGTEGFFVCLAGAGPLLFDAMTAPSAPRALAKHDARRLDAGAEHYTAYVGPPDQYDVMGASQFRLLCALGLRDTHRVLDVGCGSLRLGRLLLPYLEAGNYHGIEPNRWLIQDAVEREVGRDLVALKRPHFSDRSDFRADLLGPRFDFIVAQSIFSHTGRDLIATALPAFERALTEGGIALVTFVHPQDPSEADFAGSGWVYPDVVAFSRETVRQEAASAGLVAVELPWFHPRQTWYALGRRPEHLPAAHQMRHLSGAVLRSEAFAASDRPVE